MIRNTVLLIAFAATVQPARAAEGPFGTRHNVVVVATAPDASWLVYCQAREDTDGNGEISAGVGYHGDLLGDTMRAWYTGPDGRESPIDDYVDADPSGRYVAVVRDSRLLLIDTVAAAIVDLTTRGADTRDDTNPLGGHRAAAFGDRHVLYLRDRSVVVREVSTGQETAIDANGELFRSWLEDGWVVMLVVRNDTDGNGKLEWPTVRTSLGARHCRGPISSYSTFGGGGDQPTRLLVPLAGGEPREVDGLISTFGNELLVRRADDSLALIGTGAGIELAPATCRGQLRGVDPRRSQIVAACADGVVRVFWRGGWTDVGTENPVQLGDNLATTDRLLQLPDGALVDLESRTPLAPPDEQEPDPVLVGDRGLVHRDRQLVLLNYTTGESRPLGRSDNRYFRYRRAGPVVAAEGYVVDLERFANLGSYAGEALAVAKNGRVLVAARDADPSNFELPVGPLRWVNPR